MGYEDYIEKLNTSEAIHHERDSEMKDKKPMANYDQEERVGKDGGDDRYYEVSGISNAFDNISIGADRHGSMTISVSSGKEFDGPVQENDRKKLRDSRKRRAPEHFGEFFTNLTSGGKGAFAFRTDKNLSERRVLTEFKRAARKRVSEERREAVPFLNLEEDIARLNKLREKSGSTNEGVEQRARLENNILKKKEFQKRFVRKIKSARRRTIVKDDFERDLVNDLFDLTGDNASPDDINDQNSDDILDEDELLDILDDLDDDDTII